MKKILKISFLTFWCLSFIQCVGYVNAGEICRLDLEKTVKNKEINFISKKSRSSHELFKVYTMISGDDKLGKKFEFKNERFVLLLWHWQL